jgi:predicted metalloprotease
MKWRRVARNPHLDDRRSMGGGGFPGGGLPIAGLGIPGVIIVVVLALLGGGNVLGGGGAGGIGVDAPLDQFPAAPQGDRTSVEPLGNQAEFINFVFTDVQKFWQGQFQKAGESYQPADIVLFRSATPTGCGQGTADTGPFYCPADSTVYIDLSFYQELSQRFGAPGDFAQAYVIAHEMGHHVQNLLGIDDQVRSQVNDDPDQANALSVRQELQADCFAGVWAHSTYERGMLEKGDLQEGLTAAAAVGDDRIQRQTTGRVNPETWTHGSSKQRQTWFDRGFESGSPDACDTFSGDI